jgi:hypothetical protein
VTNQLVITNAACHFFLPPSRKRSLASLTANDNTFKPLKVHCACFKSAVHMSLRLYYVCSLRHRSSILLSCEPFHSNISNVGGRPCKANVRALWSACRLEHRTPPGQHRHLTLLQRQRTPPVLTEVEGRTYW